MTARINGQQAFDFIGLGLEFQQEILMYGEILHQVAANPGD